MSKENKQKDKYWKTELPIHIEHLGDEYDPFISALLIPEDPDDSEQKDLSLSYNEHFKGLPSPKVNPVLERRKQRQKITLQSQKEDREIVKKLKAEGKLYEDRDRIMRLIKATDGASPTFIVEQSETGREFLCCICGGKPIIIRGRNTSAAKRNSGESYSIYCQKCHVSTDFHMRLDYARRMWNSHVILGAINSDKWDDYDKYVYGSGKATPQENEYKLKLKKAEQYLDTMKLFYSYDMLYAEKINDMLEKGMVFKNYQELCSYLGEIPERQVGKAHGRNYYFHYKWWKRFFDFEKSGHKIIIKEVYGSYIPWSGDEQYPNRGRRITTFRPKLINEADDSGWGVAIRDYKLLPNRANTRNIITTTDIAKAAENQIRIEKELKKEKKKKKDMVFEEYEVYEEDWDDIYEDGENDIENDYEIDYETDEENNHENNHSIEIETNNFDDDDFDDDEDIEEE